MKYRIALLALLASGPALAGPVNGTFNGTYDCGGTSMSLSLSVSDMTDPVTAIFSFTNQGDAAGAFTMSGRFDAAESRLTLVPGQWLHQPDGYVAVGLTAVLDGDVLRGRIDNPACGALRLSRNGAAPAPDPVPQADPEPTALSGAANEPAPAIAEGSPLAPFARQAAANPASVPGTPAYPFPGNWIIDIPGGSGIWSKEVERDYIRQIETTTWTMEHGIGAKGAGVLQIDPAGTYRISWLTGRWSGGWSANPDDRFPGSLLLKHPANDHDDWIMFLDEEGRVQARKYPYGGLDYNLLRPVESSALAEYLLAEKDPSSLVGEWALLTPGTVDETGSLSLAADGTYRLADTLMERESTGRWSRKEDMLVLSGGAWGEGDAYAKFGEPGRIVVIAGGSEWDGRPR